MKVHIKRWVHYLLNTLLSNNNNKKFTLWGREAVKGGRHRFYFLMVWDVLGNEIVEHISSGNVRGVVTWAFWPRDCKVSLVEGLVEELFPPSKRQGLRRAYSSYCGFPWGCDGWSWGSYLVTGRGDIINTLRFAEQKDDMSSILGLHWADELSLQPPTSPLLFKWGK